MKIYEAELTLEGFLIFSTEVKPMITSYSSMGSYITPSPYIHNYPVMYGLLGMPSEAYFVIPSLHKADYELKGKKSGGNSLLRYTTVKREIEKFAKKEEQSLYSFPLVPKKIIVNSFLLSSESWSYALPTRKPTKNVFPRLTSYSAFSPGSRFMTYIVTSDDYPKSKLPRWIRIGKKRWGILQIYYNEVEIKDIKESTEECASSIPVNDIDTEKFGYEIKNFAKVLETSSLKEGKIGWAITDKCLKIKGEIENKRVSITLPL
ncbi:type I-D CRISPR-associated protein Csc1 [Acidianus manzaensis]|uniref:Type I-D CRISPR-associated protein Csc1 n=1 Tax=Acidianus manzaensis TaxID=282676 RepID=A0A1W6K368_9CREN|nr:type I-D CRISPR-associated protein Csc1 [Acidianus manzaensis]ARM76978.1 type I-D CRISPR-associated protein Csc1 [Acidianus manzaensis]